MTAPLDDAKAAARRLTEALTRACGQDGQSMTFPPRAEASVALLAAFDGLTEALETAGANFDHLRCLARNPGNTISATMPEYAEQSWRRVAAALAQVAALGDAGKGGGDG